MTNHISTLQNLKAFGAVASIAGGFNFASCQLSGLLWFVTREAFNLVCAAALTVWHASQPQALAAHNLLSCPVAALHLLQSALHTIAGAF